MYYYSINIYDNYEDHKEFLICSAIEYTKEQFDNIVKDVKKHIESVFEPLPLEILKNYELYPIKIAQSGLIFTNKF